MREYEILRHIVRRLREFELSHIQHEAVEYLEGFLGVVDDDPTAVYQLERLACNGSAANRSRAFHALGHRASKASDAQAALGYYHESLRVFPEIDALRSLRVRKNIATCYATDGNHPAALRILESVQPLAFSLKNLSLFDYLDNLNSWAYELGHAGRFDEAEAASRMVVRVVDPVIFPDWHDTPRELSEMRTPRRSSVFSMRTRAAAPVAEPEPPPVLSITAAVRPFVLKPEPACDYGDKMELFMLINQEPPLEDNRLRLMLLIGNKKKLNADKVNTLEKAAVSIIEEDVPPVNIKERMG